MPFPIDIPAALLRVTKLSWTSEMNHGIAESPFSGHVQVQRGRVERWSFTMDIQRMGRRDAQEAMAFFLRLEGPLGTFRMHDPAASRPLGKGTGLPVAAANTPAGSRTLATSGWLPNVATQLRAGDWVQIGDQLSKVRETVGSAADGTATLDLWPKLMRPVTTGTPIVLRPAKGIFRFTSELPSWDISAADLNRPHTFRLTGVQEILRD